MVAKEVFRRLKLTVAGKRPMDMARSRRTAQLPFSTFPQYQQLSDEAEEDGLHKSGYGDHFFPPHHHHHHSKKPHSRLWVLLLALLVVGSYFCLPSVFTFSSSPSSSSSTSSSSLHGSRPNLPFSKVEEPPAVETIKTPAERAGMEDDFTLGGLLANDVDRTKCKSRGLIHRFRQHSTCKPSSYLTRKLREYETLHQMCGPGTLSFDTRRKELEQGSMFNHMTATKQDNGGGNAPEECKYMVWIANSGLGNRLISIVSAFVYALLTQRVLLLDPRTDLDELLCEPFPGSTSWTLPQDFTHLSPMSFNKSSPNAVGQLLQQGGTLVPFKRHPVKEGIFNMTPSLPSSHPPYYVQLDVTHGYNFYDKLVFCPEEQASLRDIPWLFLKSNQYFVPSLYLYLPEFRQELDSLFPQRDAIFHHIARYLFFPTNPVWNWITRYYNAYLAKAAQIVGIQVRSFVWPPAPQPFLVDQILTCAQENKLLPRTTMQEETNAEGEEKSGSSVAVLVTSLLSDVSEHLRVLYRDHATETREVVSVHQPSHEEHQNTAKHGHNLMAWAEMCLLSFSDKLITSPVSTFGYVAQGLAGIKPWILTHVENATATNLPPSPACSCISSMEPCFHAPPYFDCSNSRGGDTAAVLPYVKHCEDVAWGLKLFSNSDLESSLQVD